MWNIGWNSFRWLFVIATLMYLGYNGSEATGEDYCTMPDLCVHGDLYGDPANCSFFYRCDYFQLEREPCADGTYFDLVTGVCQFPNSAQCQQPCPPSTEPTTPAPSSEPCDAYDAWCSSDPSSAGRKIPDKHYCTNYYLCTGGALGQSIECSHFMVFNFEQQTCVEYNNSALCDSRCALLTTEALTTEADTTTEELTTQADTTTEELTTQEDTTTEELTTQADTTTEELTTQADTTTEEITTQADTTTEELTTQEDTTTEELTTQANTTTEEITTQADTTTEELTTQADTTTEELTTQADTTTEELTTQADTTTEELTTQADTTTEEITTEELTTQAATTEVPTTEAVTTEVLTTENPTTAEANTTLKAETTQAITPGVTEAETEAPSSPHDAITTASEAGVTTESTEGNSKGRSSDEANSVAVFTIACVMGGIVLFAGFSGLAICLRRRRLAHRPYPRSYKKTGMLPHFAPNPSFYSHGMQYPNVGQGSPKYLRQSYKYPPQQQQPSSQIMRQQQPSPRGMRPRPFGNPAQGSFSKPTGSSGSKQGAWSWNRT